jgi:neutral ceramidase
MNSLQAGTAQVDITPPLEVGLLTSSVKGLYEPFQSVRLPLKARILVLRSGEEMLALVSLDLLALNDTAVGGWHHFKKELSDIIPPEKIIITCTHTHNAPESVALSGLYLDAAYRKWLSRIQDGIKNAILQAAIATKPCSVAVASSRLEGYSMQRRIPTPEGIIMSDSIQPIAPELLNREPVDRRVRSVIFQDASGNVIATLVHAICHPVHEMCMPHISAEFPGEMCLTLEAIGENGMPLFLNGAAGDINPPTVSEGPAFAQRHGQALAELVQEQGRLFIESSGFRSVYHEMKMPVTAEMKLANEKDALARLNVISIGPLAIVFIPGEPFVETALAIEKDSPFKHTIIAAYAENTIGYIPTLQASREGGYEAGPGKWSFLEKGTDALITKEVLRLLKELFNQAR